MSAPLGVALVGAGGIGNLRARAVARTPGLSLSVVSDVRKETAEAVALRHGAAAVTDYREAVKRDGVEVVVVSTPPDTHADVTLAALEAGRHVLCEKPLARSVAEGEAMCAAADSRGLLLFTGFNHRFFPAFARLHDLVTSGSLGELRAAHAFAGHQGGAEFGNSWVTDARRTGGGCLVDNGIHLLDLVRYVAGDAENASGRVSSLQWRFDGAEDDAFALFRLAGGGLATVHSTWAEWRGYRFWLEVAGTKGYARAFYPPMLLEVGKAAPEGRARRRFDLFPALQVRERLRGFESTIVASFVTELEGLAAAVAGKPGVGATGRDGLMALRMAAAVYRSAREGVEVPV